MKPKPISPMRCATASGPGSSAIPSASITSAEPQRLVTARLPCLATGTPAPATTKAARVEMLNVPAPSAPVPHRSTAPSGASTRTARARMTRAKAASSSGVSPRTRSMASSAATCVRARCRPSARPSRPRPAAPAGPRRPPPARPLRGRRGDARPVGVRRAHRSFLVKTCATPPSRETEAFIRGATLVRAEAAGPHSAGPG